MIFVNKLQCITYDISKHCMKNTQAIKLVFCIVLFTVIMQSCTSAYSNDSCKVFFILYGASYC